MKTIVVGERFSLPYVVMDTFKDLVNVLNYEKGKGWMVEEGSEHEAYMKMGEHFDNFEIVVKCNSCEKVFIVSSTWPLFGKSSYDSHVEAHKMELVTSNMQLSWATDYLRLAREEREKAWTRRQCTWCYSHMSGKYFTFLGALMKCDVCGLQKIYSIYGVPYISTEEQLYMMDKLKVNVEISEQNSRLRGITVVLSDQISEQTNCELLHSTQDDTSVTSVGSNRSVTSLTVAPTR